MGKVVSNANSISFAKGGSTKMFGKQTAGAQQPGVTSHEVNGNGKFAAGGSTKMFGKGKAGPAESGVTAKKAQ
jgi:hypothetical protein